MCWEYMHVQRLPMRGFHCCFYLVELPSWTPETVLFDMVARFRRHLHREVVLFLEKTSNVRPLTHKLTESNSSLASDVTHHSVYHYDPKMGGEEESQADEVASVCKHKCEVCNSRISCHICKQV
jgi:hypothetical protein